jgi:ketosteroid isomerase-like protein
LRAHRAQDWEGLGELFHPDARIGVFAAGGEPGDPEDAITAMREAHQDLGYYAEIESARGLDDHAIVLKGYVQHASASGRPLRAERVWLYVVVDGKLFRSQVFEDEGLALETYRRHGLELGVPSRS